jgi:hypothetical protein
MSGTSNTVVLFWFYKEISLCHERVKHFKKLNPNTLIYGLYGGQPPQNGELDDITGDLEHLYIFEEQRSAHWKWMCGDQMLVDWYRNVGFTFTWQRIFILQWDLVMYQPLDYFIGDVKDNQYAIPGVRDIEKVKTWWAWYEENKIEGFRKQLANTMHYDGPVLCSLFICALLPRQFFEYFVEREYSETYFLEYKIPTVLNALGYEAFDAPWLKPYWAEELLKKYVSVENRCLIAVGHSIPKEVVKDNLLKNRNMIFHPCYESLQELDNVVLNLSFSEKLKLTRLNCFNYAKYVVKKLLRYNRRDRGGLLKFIK